MRRRVVDAVLSLDEPYRAVVLCRFYDEMTLPEIARRLDVPLETARTRLRRAVARLRERLDDEHGASRAAWAAPLAMFARAPQAPVAAPLSLGGLLAMKVTTKIGLAAAAFVLVALAFRSTSATQGPAPASGTPLAAASPDRAISRAEASAQDAGAERRRDGSVVAQATGLVTDENGKPVAGAVVHAYPTGPSDGTWLLRDPLPSEVRRTTSGGDGRFRVSLDGHAPVFTVRAEKPGLSPGWRTGVRPGSDLTVELPRPIAARGEVMDLEGAPIADARVAWLAVIGRSLVRRETTSAADGTYAIADIPTRWSGLGSGSFPVWWIEVDAEGYAPLAIEQDQRSPWCPTADLRRDLVLIRGATIEGSVEDGETGAPIAGAPVELNWIEGGYWGSLRPRRLASATTDSDGRYRFEHVPARGFHAGSSNYGGVRNRGVVRGFVAARPAGYEPNADEVNESSDGWTISSTIRCWRAASVRGRVVDERGAPMTGLQVFLHADRRDLDWIWSSYVFDESAFVRTDAEGRFAYATVGARRAPEFVIQPKVPANEWLGGESPEPGCRMRISLKPGDSVDLPDLVVPDSAMKALLPSVRVRVRDTDGRPIWGAQVRGFDSRLTPPPPTDEAGSCVYSLESRGLPEKRMRLRVTAPGYARGSTPEVTPSVEAPPEVEVRLAPPRRLAGRVEDADGAPVASAQVIVVNPGVPTDVALQEGPVAIPPTSLPHPVTYGRTETDARGRFELDDLPEGPYTVVATAEREGQLAVLTGVATDARDVVVALPPRRATPKTFELAGTVRDATTRKPIADFSIAIRRGAVSLFAERDRPGRFHFPAVTPGEFRLTVSAPGYASPDDRPIVLRDDATPAPLDVVLDRGVTVKGRLVRPESTRALAAGLTFNLDADGASRRVVAKVGSDGNFEISGLRAGVWRIDAFLERQRTLALDPPVVLEVAKDARVVELELAAVEGVGVNVEVQSALLPPPRHEGDATEDQLRARAGSRIEIRDAQGRLAWFGACDSEYGGGYCG
ncbi:MAG TPA: carboxypeptidase regulatory-like domain-containing protein, partial [Planctomycetota bacterium]|nr:carboxypeptidase regulatory-like domain-containing protein [Planctomycetota bacterium]